ncbi:hypothetical protein V2J09_018944 [Rumex salicifolius]
MEDRSCVDSGASGVEEVREKPRWTENSKVYTRKIRKASNNGTAAANQNTATTEDANVATTSAAAVDENKSNVSQANVAAQDENDTVTTAAEVDETVVPPLDSQSLPAKDANSQPQQLSPLATEVVCADLSSMNRQEVEILNTPLLDSQSLPAKDANSPRTKVVCDDSSSLNRHDEELVNIPLPDSQSSPAKDTNSQPQQPSSPKTKDENLNRQEGELVNVPLPDSQSSLPAKDIDTEMQQLNSPRAEAVCDDTSSLNRQEGGLPNGDDVASVKSAVTRVGDKVSIRLSSATSKQEARELKRKLVSDLDQVRSLAKRLDTKESQLFNGGLTNSAETGTGGVITGVGGQSLSQYSTSAAMGQGVGLNDSRPFRRLSVSVMDINRRGGSEIVEKEKRTPKANQFYQSSDFICGKERLPPAESNKKQKSSGGGRKKQSGGGSDFDKQMFKKCGTLLQQIMKHKFGWVFNTPVDVKGLCLHDYYDVIKHPMDLGTVKNRLSKNWYKSLMEFAEDVRLTFRNAMTYNPEGQDVHVMALELSNLFEQKWVEIQAEYSRKLRYEGLYDVGLPTPTSRLTPLPFYGSPPPTTPSAPRPVYQEMKHLDRSESFSVPVDPRSAPVYSAPVGRAPAPKKPKAKDPNKRDMTYEEKQKLSTHLQDLPSEKLDSIVQIIKKRNPSLCQQGEEIEVDIDSVDAETLWELDRFVINYKKTLSKHKRKAELALQKAQAQQSIQASDPGTMGSKVPNETTPGDVPSPAREAKQTDNASNSSSSSSSSSDSGSSSSDSDSDSSSGSGSDGGE